MGLDEGCVESHEVRGVVLTVFADPSAVYLDDGSGIGILVVIGTTLLELYETGGVT